MSPAPALDPVAEVVRARPARRGRPARVLVTAAAVLGVAVHLWGLYRDSGPPGVRWFPHVDKLEHLVGFGLPCFLVLLAAHLHAGAVGRPLGVRAIALVVGLFAVHAVLSEVVQADFYTTRSGDPADAVADLVGTALGLLGFLVVRRRTGGGAVRGAHG